LLKKDNLLVRLISFLIACFLWIFVSVQNNPITEKTYDVRLSQINLPSAMTVYSAPEKISVTVRGSKTVLSAKSAGEIFATANFKNVTEGQQKIPVKVNTKIGEIVSYTPSEISVYVDTISQKSVPVQTRMVGTPVEDMTLGNITIKPNFVTIKGATHRLDKVNRVVAPVDVTERSGNFEAESELVAVSDDGYDIPNMVITPQRVLVNAVMMPQLLTVELPVELVTIGEPPIGYEMKEAKLDPIKVRVSASPSKLKGITVVKTKPLDISKLVNGSTPIVELDLPEKAISNTSVVKAHITMVKQDSEPLRDSVDGSMENRDVKPKKGKEKKHEVKNQ